MVGDAAMDMKNKYSNQLAKAAMDGATEMDGDGRRNRATAMAAMEHGR